MLITYLNRLKEERNMTNQEIADLSGVPVGTVGRIFSGNAKNPGHEAVVAIVRALGGDMNAACEMMSAGANGRADVPAPPSAVSELAETFDELARRKDEMHRATIEHLEKAHHADTDRLERAYEKERQRQHAVIIALIIAMAIMIAGIIIVAIFDVITPNAGWINNETLAAVVKGVIPQ